MKRRLEVIVVGMIALGCLGVLTLGYAIAEPKSDLGYRLFKAEYALAPALGASLPGYRARLWNCDGGYVSPAVQQFLNERLTQGAQSEVAAIADFWVQQAQGRECGFIPGLSSRARPRLTAAVMRQLPSYAPLMQDKALFLVEEVRGQRELGKGNFYVAEPALFARNRQGLSQRQIVLKAYQEWWRAPTTWEQKVAVDPLRTKGIRADTL